MKMAAIIVEALPVQHVNNFLAEKGFPIFKTEQFGVLEFAKKLLGKKHDVKHLLAGLENPVDVVANIVEKVGKN